MAYNTAPCRGSSTACATLTYGRRSTTTGALVTDRDGRVEIVYKPAARREGLPRRRAQSRRRSRRDRGRDRASENRAPEKPASKPSRTSSAQDAATQARAHPQNAIHVWTDGACTGNPGPAGLGVVIIDGESARELSEYLGEGTNNIAELTRDPARPRRDQGRARPVVVYTDSQYSIGLLTKPGRRRRTSSSSPTCARCAAQFPDLRFVKVAGHAGCPAQRARRSSSRAKRSRAGAIARAARMNT